MRSPMMAVLIAVNWLRTFTTELVGSCALSLHIVLGTFKWKTGNSYSGQWLDGRRNGKGTFRWVLFLPILLLNYEQFNGDVYEGDWVSDTRTGRGTLTWKIGDRYVGDYQNGKRTGFGIFYWQKTGDRYEGIVNRLCMSNLLIGEWKDGNHVGYGKFYWSNGDVYEGEWVRTSSLCHLTETRRMINTTVTVN